MTMVNKDIPSLSLAMFLSVLWPETLWTTSILASK